MKQYRAAVFAAGLFVLAACGGGGGSSPSGGAPPTQEPTSTPTAAAGTTTASGVVVDDRTGNPIAGVKVALMPWGPCGATPSPATSITPGSDGCPTALPSPQPTTGANGTFTLSAVPDGQYVLVIGNDVTHTPPPGYVPPSCTTACGTPTPAPFTVQAVVHDNITLTGGNQTLKAPVLPGNSYYTPPAWETNGEYRLATLDASTEMPCYIAWEYERAQNGLAGSSVDEWLTENVRANNVLAQKAPSGTALTTLTVNSTNTSGGTSCNQDLIDPALFAGNPYAKDVRSIWFAAQYVPYNASVAASAVGLGEFPIDPRSNADPSQPAWR